MIRPLTSVRVGFPGALSRRDCASFPLSLVALQLHLPEIRMVPQTLLSQWREAHTLAMAAERAAFEASMAYLRGNGPRPPEGSMEEARRLRAHASQLFKRAMAHFENVLQRGAVELLPGPRQLPPPHEPGQAVQVLDFSYNRGLCSA
jgi:hypothetical protein